MQYCDHLVTLITVQCKLLTNLMNFCNNLVELQAVCMLVQFVNFSLVKIHKLQCIAN